MMHLTIEQIATWGCSIVSLAGVWAYGNRDSLSGPIIGILAFIPWMTFAIAGEHWGLMPANFLFVVLHIRNLLKWKQHTPAASVSDTRTADA